MDNKMNIQQEMISQIRDIMINARRNAAVRVINEQLLAYWNIGRVIVGHEQDNDKSANSGGADAEQRHFWNQCDGVHDGSISAPISIPFFQLI